MQFSRSYLLLFAQLLVFFFVSSLTITSSKVYANISEIDIKNYAVYIGVNKGGKTEQYMIDWLETATWTNFYNAISNYIDNDSYDVFLYSQGSEIYFYYRASNTTSKLYIRDMSIYSITAPNFNGYRVNTISTNASNFSYYNSQYVNNLKANSFYTDLPIYSSSSYASITFNGGTSYPSSVIFDGPFESSPLGLAFINKPSDTIVDVWAFEDVPLYKFSGDEDFYFGQLYVPFTANTYETNSNFFYRWGDWQFRTLPDSATYLDYVGSDEQAALYDVYLDKNYLYDNTIYSLVWTDTTTDPYTLAAANFYLGDKNTIIVDGTVDPSKTFSGDYDDKYNYQNDPNQNFWKDTYNRFMTPSGDVLRGTITTLMSELDLTTSGEESGELMMALVGLDVISNDFGDFIISWNDFDPHFSIKGNSITPMSDGNIIKNTGHFIPAGQINFSALEREHETFHDIMQYTRAILSFSVICLFFNNLWHTLLITLGISTQIYEKDQINKEKLIRQAERDQRKLEREDRQRYQQWLYEHRR